MQHLPVLTFLKLQLSGKLPEGATTHMQYPTAISRLLDIRIAEVDEAFAVVEIDASPERHGNQQGTVHGGLICELADAAIGTAHSTLMEEGESFASIELKVSFMRPVFRSTLRATARAINRGRTITHYQCDITRDDGKLVAVVTSSVMTLRGEQAQGR
jgi:uncharacterized protein (TIGR00369 family)